MHTKWGFWVVLGMMVSCMSGIAHAADAPPANPNVNAVVQLSPEQAKRVQVIQSAMETKEGTVIRGLLEAEGRRKLIDQLTRHPRFVPFMVTQVAWLLAFVLLQSWIVSVIPWTWIARLLNIVLLEVYLVGAVAGLPFGIFTKDLMPYYRVMAPVIAAMKP